MNNNFIKIMCVLCSVILLASCNHQEEEYHTVAEKIKAKSIHPNSASVHSSADLEDINTIEVTENGITFLIPDRKGEIKSYACTECHTKPLARMKSKDLKKAHWDINLKHAKQTTMNCLTCHNKSDIDNLNSLTGANVDFNKSYKVCSQCHQKEFKDWTGGAHGKRVKNWTSPRVSMSCVNCHNPHSPSFESKWPERYNTQKIKERN